MMYMGEKNLIVDDEESMPDLICNYSEKDTKHQDDTDDRKDQQGCPFFSLHRNVIFLHIKILNDFFQQKNNQSGQDYSQKKLLPVRDSNHSKKQSDNRFIQHPDCHKNNIHKSFSGKGAFKKDNRNQLISQSPVENIQIWRHKAKIRKGTHQTEKQITDPELFSQIFFIQKNIKKALYDRQSTAFHRKK